MILIALVRVSIININSNSGCAARRLEGRRRRGLVGRPGPARALLSLIGPQEGEPEMGSA